MIKLPRYKGFLVTEYIPVVFNLSAACDLVLRPDVPRGTYPTVKHRSAKPKNETVTAILSQRSPNLSPNLRSTNSVFFKAIRNKGISSKGR